METAIGRGELISSFAHTNIVGIPRWVAPLAEAVCKIRLGVRLPGGRSRFFDDNYIAVTRLRAKGPVWEPEMGKDTRRR
jgi:hypothetical protein